MTPGYAGIMYCIPAYLGKHSSFKVRRPATPLVSFLARWIKSVTAIRDRLTCKDH